MSFIGGSLFLRKRRLDKRSCKSKQNFNKRWTFLRRCVRMWVEQDEGSFCMKKTGKKGLALLLSVLMAFSCMLFASAEEAAPELKFNDGKLKIVVFADCQDDVFADGRMVEMMNKALDNEQPDLVVFTGDNVVQAVKPLNQAAIDQILEPVVSRGIPFAVTFGNHDGEHFSKESMLAYYQSYPGCLSYDADPALTGTGNCNIPVYSSDGSEIVYNIWMIDSNMYDEVNGGYDYVHQDQLDWYVRTSEALEAQVGHKVPSLVFQHIVVPEVYECLREAEAGDTNTREYMGKTYALELNDSAEGYLGEFPCPPTVNGGQFDTFLSRGDVVGIVTGHDHVNSFVGSYQGIDFIQMPGITFSSYGDDAIRGYGVIELSESDLSEYEAYSVQYPDSGFAEDAALVLSGFLTSLKYMFERIVASLQDLLSMLAAA